MKNICYCKNKPTLDINQQKITGILVFSDVSFTHIVYAVHLDFFFLSALVQQPRMRSTNIIKVQANRSRE